MTAVLSVQLLSLLVVVNIGCSTACDGFKLKLNKIVNCGSDNVISIDKNFTVSLSKKCEIISNGCVSSKGFTEAKIKYVITKNGMPVKNGEPDICQSLDTGNEEEIGKLAMMGFPTHCPIPEGRQCTDAEKPIDMTKYKKYLSLARGKFEAKADITHDSGTSCIKVEFEVYK